MGTKPPTASEPTKPSIAIIGMACEFPGAHSPEELWQNVLAGRRFFRKAPTERLPREYFDSDPLVPGKSYCDQMAVIEGWQLTRLNFGFRPLPFTLPTWRIGLRSTPHARPSTMPT
jgi:enediyne polyketide synthase